MLVQKNVFLCYDVILQKNSLQLLPSCFFVGDFSGSFSSGLLFSGDFGFTVGFFSLKAVRLRDKVNVRIKVFLLLFKKPKHSLRVFYDLKVTFPSSNQSMGIQREEEQKSRFLKRNQMFCNCQKAQDTNLTLLSIDFSFVGGLVTGRLVLTTFTGCCSLPALLYLLLSNFGLGTPYFLKIFQHRK